MWLTFWENDEALEDGANLWCWDTRGSTYKESGFSMRCTCYLCFTLIPVKHKLRTANPGYEFQSGETKNQG